MILCGPHRAGKTSIARTVFQKMSPHETMFLEETPKVEILSFDRNPLMRFKILDVPGNMSMMDPSDPSLAKAQVVAFVVDAQDEPYTEAIAMARKVMENMYKVNPRASFDILIHKLDGDHLDNKSSIVRDMEARLDDELGDKIDIKITIHTTSIYDHSVFDAVSKLVQKLNPQLNLVERCLDLLIQNSKMEKAYLFDLVYKVYVASDTMPGDIQTYELCSDMLDVVIEISCIYGNQDEGALAEQALKYDPRASCVIKLDNRNLLYMREVDRCLALVCIIREDNFERQHLIDHNIGVFKEALHDMYAPQLFVSGN